MPDDSRFQQRVQRISGLVQQVESLADPAARAVVRNLLQTVMEMQGAGFERVLEILAGQDQDGERLIGELCEDPLVASLLVLHGLHPLDFESRVRTAFEKLEPAVQSQGGKLELLGIGEDTVHLRLTAHGHGCGVSSLRKQVEDAMYAAAPDLSHLSIEDGTSHTAIVPLEKLLSAPLTAGRTADESTNQPLRAQ